MMKPGSAEAALQSMLLAKSDLDGVHLLGIAAQAPVGRQPLDGRDLAALRLHGKKQAGAHSQAIQQDRADAAGAVLAADVGAGQVQLVAQEVAQQHARFDRALVGCAVYRDGDGVGGHGLHSAYRVKPDA